jgi:uncharacterized membrane protein YhaH (DUF805 family)
MAMSFATRLGTLLFDPRGRVTRQDLLVAAIIMVLADLAAGSLAGDGHIGLVCKSVVLWMGCAAVIKRLHDVGRSGWWVLGGMAAICIWTAVIGLGAMFTLRLDTLDAGSTGYIILFSVLMLPALGITLWLHLAEGDAFMNRFGPVPAGLAAAPEGSSVSAPAGSQT